MYIYIHYNKGCDFLKLGEVIVEYRNKNNISQNELAKRINVPNSTILRLENGHMTNPTLRILIALSEELEITIDELIFGKRRDDVL